MSGNVSNHIWVTDSTKPLGGYWARASGLSTGAAHVIIDYPMTQVVPETSGGTPTPESAITDADAVAVVITINHGDTVEGAARLTNKYPQVLRCLLGETIVIGPLLSDVTKIMFDTENTSGTLGGTAVDLVFSDTGVRKIVVSASALTSNVTNVRVEGYVDA